MQVIGMLGYVDKYDFVINLAKTINIMDKSVLVVDATFEKKLKYIVPALDNIGNQYVTQYDGIDFAVGFESMHDVEDYMTEQSINIALYDYILIDIDSPQTYEFFRNRNFDKIYFFIDSEILSVNKNKDLIKAIKVYHKAEDVLEFSKVLYKAYLSRAADDYLNTQITEYNVKWKEQEYEIPIEDQDKMANIDSQFSGIINIKKHTRIFINTIADITAEILESASSKEVINQIKRRKE
jgi:thiol-disulfide isomerase/thioredoxin